MGAVVVEFSLELLEEALGLSEGYRVVGVDVDRMTRVIRLRIDGPELPECAEGARPVMAGVNFRARRGDSELVVLSASGS